MISVLKMIKFNVASINTCTETEGPYKRLAIWFQGCNIHCKGCCNPDYQPLAAKNILSLEELVAINLNIYPIVVFGMAHKDEVVNGDNSLYACCADANGQFARKTMEDIDTVVLQLFYDAT